MAAASDYLEDALLDHVFRGDQPSTSYTQPTAVYMALYTSDPTDADAGTEVAGGSYARQQATFNAPSAGAIGLAAQIDFTGMPAASVTHWGIRDDPSAGNLLAHGAWDSAVSTQSGDTVQIQTANFSISLA